MTDSIIDLATFNTLKEMVGDDFIAELVQTFLEDSPTLLGELDLALQSGDGASFRRAAHALKSTSASMGALGLAEGARALEMMGAEDRLDEAAGRLEQVNADYEAVARTLGEMV